MPTFTWSQVADEPVAPEESRARAAIVRGERIAVGRYVHPAGSAVEFRAPAAEHIHSILTGRAAYQVGGEERAVGPGEAVLIRPGVPHAIRFLEDTELIGFHEVGPTAGTTPGRSGGPAFFTWNDMKSDLITPKYSSGRGPTITGERLEVAFMFYPAGTEAKRHSHPNEQIQVALGGKARYFIADEAHVIGAGGGVLFPSNVEHWVEILEDYTVINCKDIVAGWSVYHARWER